MYSITLQSRGLLVSICYNVFTNKKGLTTVPRPQPVHTEFADHCLV